jgi:hypothetical protein
MADRIANLPPSQEKPLDIDVNVMRDLFGDRTAVAESPLQLKKLIIPAILFVVLSLPIVDSILKNAVPDSNMVILFVKTLIFFTVLVVLQVVSG